MLAASPENVLFAHKTHSALPMTVLNVPETHARHTPPSGPVYPVLQTHTTLEPTDCEFAPQFEHTKIDVAPITVEKVFAEQLVHSAVPVAGLYLPGTHREHGPPFGPVAPVLQLHAVIKELPATELELSAHATQVAAAVAPVEVEYVPIPQSVHAALPLIVLYLPATQGEQNLWSCAYDWCM